MSIHQPSAEYSDTPHPPGAAPPTAQAEPVKFAPVTLRIADPVQQADRIISIDVLRGVALLGILVMNIQSFAMVDAAYMIPTASTLDFTGINYAIWFAGRLFADQKFMSIFSMLFGAGIIIMTSRTEAKGYSAAEFHYRRTAMLLMIGILHAYLLWVGDILYSYAMCGFFVFLLRKLKPHWLIAIAVVSLSIPFALSLGYGSWLLSGSDLAQRSAEGYINEVVPSTDNLQRELSAYRGGWLGQAVFRFFTVVMIQTVAFAFLICWRVVGMMLLGMALFKMGVFSAKRSNTFYTLMLIIGMGIGLPAIAYEISLAHKSNWDPIQYLLIIGQINYWASILVALGWVSLVMLLCKSTMFGKIKRALAAVGQTALTNYLLHTIICTTIFYGGYGFGLYGTLERWQQILIVIAIWTVQIICSQLWLKLYKYGPFEWVWRSLTYWKLQPLKR